MSTRKRVLFVINSLTGGGAERVMSTLLSASSDYRERYEIALALLDSEPAAYTTPDWLPVHRLDSRHSLPASVINLARVARSFRPDVSVSFLSRANFSTVLVAKRYGHKAIISERVNSSAHFGTGAKAAVSKAALRALYPRADAVITPSVGVADDLCENFGVRRDKTTVIANPIDVAAIGKLAAQPIDRPTAGPYLIAVGRLMPTKNFETLIAAYAQAQVAPALVILGRGPLKAALREQIAAANLTERVILAGFHENPFAVMHNALAYVSASRSEGFPNSLVEAMAVHLPVVSSNCASGPSEILAGKPRDQVVGIEYAPHGILTPVDDVDALASVIRSLDDPDLRHRYAEAAHARALTYDVAMATRRFWEVIEGSVR